MEFVPEHAPMVVLGFLFAGFVLGVAALMFVYSLWTSRLDRAKKIFLAGLCVAGGYGLLLLAFSLASEERVLAAGEKKYFCEVDCHLAYSVVDAKTAKMLGSGEKQATAAGTFYVVTLRTYFDEKTTSVNRGNGLLHPNLRMVRMLDDQGRSFSSSLEGLKALDALAEKMVPLDQSLRPGDSYETTLVFDVPTDAKNLRLWLTDPLPLNWLLIGHENSFFHKKVYFVLPVSQQAAKSR